MALAAFALLYAAVALRWGVPRWMAWAYAATSVLCFVAYAIDKAAARAHTWRTRENTLHAMAVLGGWPGALLAQQFLRHKSSKAAFRKRFWVTVGLNAIAFTVLNSPWLHHLRTSN